MKWYNNLKIKTKLLTGFIIVIILTVALAVIGYVQLRQIDNNYTNLLNGAVTRSQAATEIGRYYARLRRIATSAVVNSGNTSSLSSLRNNYKTELANLDASVTKYLDGLKGDFQLDSAGTESRKNTINTLSAKIHSDYNNVVDDIFRYAEAGDEKSSNTAMMNASSLADGINNDIDQLIDIANTMTQNVSDSMTVLATTSQTIMIVVSIIAVLLALIIAIFIAEIITKGITEVADAAHKITEGDFNVSVGSNYKDEIAGLSNNLAQLKSTIQKLVQDIRVMSDDFTKGEIDTRIDEATYHGEYQVVAKGINNTVTGLLNDTQDAIGLVTEIGNGNFDITIKQYPGKKENITSSFKSVQANLKKFNSDISGVIKGAADGNLDVSINASQYRGDWNKMAEGVNSLLKAVVEPTRETIEIMKEVSTGNFDNKMNGSYKGEFLVLKNAINSTVSNVASYIDEISKVLTGLSEKNLDQSITREYVGKFSNIKEALNNIIDTLNNVISDIASAAEQVAAGAKQISESSMTLAQGATEQASSVEELNATVLTINENTTQNADNAKEAEHLSNSSKQSASKGQQDMNNMLSSMEGIKESSNKISNIIKTIDSIAFQTNLLALNAAVEAARAGENGRGFAVVAEEVRNLAAKSQDAAKDTASLIEESINKVNEGTKIAGQTAGALQAIVSDVAQVADIITGISAASQEQAMAVGQVTIGLSQITEVVQSNSATSEESASASQELSSQAEMLQSMVKVFNIKKSFRIR